jgi:YfiH family protein
MNMSNHERVQPNDNLLAFPALVTTVLFHGVFKRKGGISPAPWDSQNVAFGLGDAPQNVSANREGIKKALGCKHLVSAKQFDALVTNVPGLGLMIQQADCQAVMLFDPENIAVGIAHVGWRGSVANIIRKTVFAMVHAYATAPADLIAAISPSLGPCCAEFVNYRSELPASMHGYQVQPNYFDFWAISRDQLCAAGVRPGNIHDAKICTCCNRDYFSYRRDRETGRFASVIGIK